MTALVPAFVVALVLAAAALALLALVVSGIHAAERRKSLSAGPKTRREALARWVLGVPAATKRPANSRR
jgi:hypothetical protein